VQANPQTDKLFGVKVLPCVGLCAYSQICWVG